MDSVHGRRITTLACYAATTADLPAWTGAAVEQPAATIGNWATIRLLLGTGERNAAPDTAMVRNPSAAAGCWGRAHAAANDVAAPITDRSTFGSRSGAGFRWARTGSALVRDTAATASLPSGTHAALFDATAAVANGAACRIGLCASARGAGSAALARDASTTADLRRHAFAAVEDATAAVANVTAGC